MHICKTLDPIRVATPGVRVCACVRACVRVCVRECVRVHACVRERVSVRALH